LPGGRVEVEREGQRVAVIGAHVLGVLQPAQPRCRQEPICTALRYFALDGTDHPTHKEQSSMIRAYLIWRNTHHTDPALRKVVRRAETIKRLPSRLSP